jgi:hypothetical protein
MTIIVASLTVLILAWASTARGGTNDRLAQVARQVFGARAGVALCIAHYESTDGRFLYNGSNLGPWQINVDAHRWVDRRRVVADWLYSARAAYAIAGCGSRRGCDWSPWTTHRLCGV